jgi:hypothetical protein
MAEFSSIATPLRRFIPITALAIVRLLLKVGQLRPLLALPGIDLLGTLARVAQKMTWLAVSS